MARCSDRSNKKPAEAGRGYGAFVCYWCLRLTDADQIKYEIGNDRSAASDCKSEEDASEYWQNDRAFRGDTEIGTGRRVVHSSGRVVRIGAMRVRA